MCFFIFMSGSLSFLWFFFLMIRRPPRSTQSRSSAASDVYKRQIRAWLCVSPSRLLGDRCTPRIHGSPEHLYGVPGIGHLDERPATEASVVVDRRHPQLARGRD